LLLMGPFRYLLTAIQVTSIMLSMVLLLF
jgi:hypothetical protein